jgi:hypothetical protein
MGAEVGHSAELILASRLTHKHLHRRLPCGSDGLQQKNGGRIEAFAVSSLSIARMISLRAGVGIGEMALPQVPRSAHEASVQMGNAPAMHARDIGDLPVDICRDADRRHWQQMAASRPPI